MKISYKWLKNYINLDLSVTELEKELTFSGIEVEAIETQGDILEQIIVSEIKERTAHPGSDHLSICKVDNGTETLQVICGAPNCDAGSKVALAPVGADLGGFKIKKAKLRGEASFGMLCSEKELGISENHDGIMILDADYETGKKLSEYYDISDVIYDVEITPNRPDLLGITGVARDLSALLHKEAKLPKAELPKGTGNISDHLKLDNQAPDLCTRYTARMIKGVKIGKSPEWMSRSLEAVGLRSINNVVDATNYVMMELGHPLHAFDHKLIADQTIIMRRAKKDEKFTDLHGEDYKLCEDDLVIADPQKATALAGVIGAANSQVNDDTQDIVIEAANFLYSGVRKTSKRLAIFTDSAYRFERDMSDEQADYASRRCCELILQTAGGELVEGVLDSYPNPAEIPVVNLRPSRVKKVLSVWIEPQQIVKYLESLGLTLIEEKDDLLRFESPHFRKDLIREVDLIEELIRLHGYNKIETKFKPQNIMNFTEFKTKRQLLDRLLTMGFCEVVNWSFSDPEDLDKLNIEQEDYRRNTVSIKNPLGSSYSIMRPMLLPDVLRNVISNINHGQKDLKLFEMNKTFLQSSGKLAKEQYQLCGVLTGLRASIFWGNKQEPVDFYAVKGIIHELLALLRVSNWEEKASTEKYYLPGNGLDFYIGEKLIASFGKLDPKIMETYEIKQECYSFELYIDEIFSVKRQLLPVYEEIVKFPPVLRDLSFIISRVHDVSAIEEVMQKASPNLLNKIVLYDEYKGKNMASEKRSLTFSLVFSSGKKTLNDKIIAKEMKKIIQGLEDKFEIEMR